MNINDTIDLRKHLDAGYFRIKCTGCWWIFLMLRPTCKICIPFDDKEIFPLLLLYDTGRPLFKLLLFKKRRGEALLEAIPTTTVYQYQSSLSFDLTVHLELPPIGNVYHTPFHHFFSMQAKEVGLKSGSFVEIHSSSPPPLIGRAVSVKSYSLHVLLTTIQAG